MNGRSLGALVVLNLALLVAVVMTSIAPEPVLAQGLGGRGGNYVMIAGEVRGRTNQAGIYILDMNAATIHWIFYNSSNNRIDVMASRDVGPDLDLGRAPR